jgi:hypothetical protein
LELYNFSFENFTIINIENSILSNINTVGVTWFKKETLNAKESKEITDHITYWKNNREVYRQLKFAMEKQGNKIQALEFQSYEMGAFRNELKPQKIFKDKFILYLSWTNDFGINWRKPLFISLLTTLFFYAAIVICISKKIEFSFSVKVEDINNTCSELKHYFPAYFKLFNPLFIFDKTFIEVKSDTFMISFWEFLHRIVISYLLFQIVSAFRKFVK